jgi:hypothetical protein
VCDKKVGREEIKREGVDKEGKGRHNIKVYIP